MNMQREVNKIKRNGSQKANRLLKIAPYPVALILILILIFRIAGKNSSSNDQAQNNSNTQVAGAIADTTINKDFSIPLSDTSGEEIGGLQFTIESAERRKEIFVKGQKATAVEGREFLIINMKIENNSNRGVDVNSRDYIRLSTNGNEDEWLAPDIHNDPVEVQAISTKPTRVGFPINSTDSLLMLQIGDIADDKEKVLLEF